MLHCGSGAKAAPPAQRANMKKIAQCQTRRRRQNGRSFAAVSDNWRVALEMNELDPKLRWLTMAKRYTTALRNSMGRNSLRYGHSANSQTQVCNKVQEEGHGANKKCAARHKRIPISIEQRKDVKQTGLESL